MHFYFVLTQFSPTNSYNKTFEIMKNYNNFCFMRFKSYTCVLIDHMKEIHILINEKSNQETADQNQNPGSKLNPWN